MVPSIATVAGSRALRALVARPFMSANEWLWSRLPASVTMSRPMLGYGAFLHSLERLRSARTQFHGTFFFRNRPELELMRSLVERKTRGSTVKCTVLACSNGAEVYSIVWTLRSARPDLKVAVRAVDISNEILELAKAGLYSLETNDLVNSPIFERISEREIEAMFDRQDGELRVKAWLKDGIRWQVGDAGDPTLADCLGEQDIVVANKFLCHMRPSDAERCLRNLARLVKPGGYLFVSGVDLEVRTKVAVDSGWTPVLDLIEEMHNGDSSVRADWPWRYWGLEPFDRTRPDWNIRYASAFQIGVPRLSSKGLNCCSSIEDCG